MQFFEYPKCSTCRKAKAELKSLGLDFEAHDLVAQPPTSEDFLTWFEESGLEIKAFFNTSGLKYRELGLKDKLPSLTAQKAAELLASDGMLVKRPLLIKEGQVLQIGYRKPYQDLDL